MLMAGAAASPAPPVDLHLERRAAEVDLVAGVEADAATVVAADFDRAAGAEEEGAGGAAFVAQPEGVALGVPGDASMLAGDGLLDLALLHEGDVVAALDPAGGVEDLLEAAEVDAVGVEVVGVPDRLALEDGEAEERPHGAAGRRTGLGLSPGGCLTEGEGVASAGELGAVLLRDLDGNREPFREAGALRLQALADLALEVPSFPGDGLQPRGLLGGRGEKLDLHAVEGEDPPAAAPRHPLRLDVLEQGAMDLDRLDAGHPGPPPLAELVDQAVKAHRAIPPLSRHGRSPAGAPAPRRGARSLRPPGPPAGRRSRRARRSPRPRSDGRRRRRARSR